MKTWRFMLPVAAMAVLFTAQAAAQSEGETRQRELKSREVELTVRLKEAEARMAAAARQIAEISSQRMPRLAQIERSVEMANRPRIGVTIGAGNGDQAVEGVLVDGVTPGSAADDAGMRAGDIITAINDESLSAASSNEANQRLLDFMLGAEESDEFKLEYLRNGNSGSVVVSPRRVEMRAFRWAPDGQSMHVERFPGVGDAPQVLQGFRMNFGFPWAGSSLGSMELVELNAGLGKYFGTDTGLLVVNAPKADGLALLDGDVIQSIDGREPKDVRHAMRILSSYQGGETLQLGIMRNKKKRTLEIEIPVDQRSSVLPELRLPAMPARVPVPPPAPLPAAVAETST